ncbi:unnamed protein product, partial [Durusdinium trenchii]
MRDQQRAWIMNGLRHLRAPAVIATLVGLVFAVPGLDFEKPIDHFEAFSGSAESMAVTRGEWEEGRRAVPFDISISEDMTLLSDQGFANALFHCCNLKPG